MSMRKMTSAFSTRETPQSRPIPGREADMTENSAGGFSFKVDHWTRLARFLILGSDGSYYASSRKMTEQNANVVLECLAEDGKRTVDFIGDVSEGGRAPKNTPAVFALAMACKLAGDDETRAYAYKALHRVARIPTHLFEWTEAIKAFGGFTTGYNRAVARWYIDPQGRIAELEAMLELKGAALKRAADSLDLPEDFDGGPKTRIKHVLGLVRAAHERKVALHAVKYQSREGWSNADLLRLAKPGASHKIRRGARNTIPGAVRDSVLDHTLGWMTGRWAPGNDPAGDATDIIWAFERAKAIGLEQDGKVSKERTQQIVKLIEDYGLPRETIPTQYLNEVAVWEALLMASHGMPMTAMIRNLPKMTAIGLLAPLSDAVKHVRSALNDEEKLRRARVHPLSVLVAMRTYAQGRGVLGSLTWNPVAQVVDALDGAFYKSFRAVEPTGLRWLLALDISGSMGHAISGMPGVSCRDAAAAMAMVTARVEQDHHIVGFASSQNRSGYSYGYGGASGRSVGTQHWVGPREQFRNTWGNDDGLSPLAISPRQRLDDVVRTIQEMPAGGTDCALPMIYALDRKIPVDVVVVYTDNETWAGRIAPVQALDAYKQKMGIDTKLIVVGMVSNGFSIADPKRSDNLDVVGFDTSAPSVMSQFARGDFAVR